MVIANLLVVVVVGCSYWSRESFMDDNHDVCMARCCYFLSQSTNRLRASPSESKCFLALLVKSHQAMSSGLYEYGRRKYLLQHEQSYTLTSWWLDELKPVVSCLYVATCYYSEIFWQASSFLPADPRSLVLLPSVGPYLIIVLSGWQAIWGSACQQQQRRRFN